MGYILNSFKDTENFFETVDMNRSTIYFKMKILSLQKISSFTNFNITY